MFDMNRSLYHSLHSQNHQQSQEQQRTSSASSQIDKPAAAGTSRATTEFQIASSSSSQGGLQFQTTSRMKVIENVSIQDRQ